MIFGREENESQDMLQRVPVYPVAGGGRLPSAAEEILQKGNASFHRSPLTWISLFFLLIIYPGSTVLMEVDSASLLSQLNDGTRMILLVATIVVQWLIFLMLFVAVYFEKTGLAGLGFKRIRSKDLLWAVTFLIVANLILSGLAWLLAQVGLPMPGEIAMLIPKDPAGRIVWVFLSITAGVCEETAFRGYLMTRLRLVGGMPNWILPSILSAVAFGACHAYQGIPGFIIITTYGLMFSFLYVRTGSIWPGIIAHFFQDFGALFYPQ